MPELDKHDLELLESFQQLGPLLQAASLYQREKEEEPQHKRAKAGPNTDGQDPRQSKPPVQEAMMGMLKVMATLLLQHERSIQLQRRQDSFVIYAQVNPQGAVPLLAQMAVDWKKIQQQNPDSQKLPTLRTFLFKGLVKETHLRVQKMSKSRQGEDLWDRALQRGILLQDGSWTFQKWSHEDQCLVQASRPPLSMDRLLRQLQHLEELLEDSVHIVRFHSLKAQKTVAPWYLQLDMRHDEVWHIMNELQQLGMWSLLGLAVKMHSQTQSRQAQILQQCLQNTPSGGKSKGKGKQHGKYGGR